MTIAEKREVFNVFTGDLDLVFDFGSASDLLDGLDKNQDFTVDINGCEFRLIPADDIDEIQQDELGADEYILGCFNASFLAGVTSIDIDVINTLQNAKAFKGLGKLLKDQGYIEAIQEECASADGYGHHFAHYDHNEYEAADWHIFRTY